MILMKRKNGKPFINTATENQHTSNKSKISPIKFREYIIGYF